MQGGSILVLRMASESILVEYRHQSFLPWLAYILLDAAMRGDFVWDLANVVFIISKIPYSTKPMVILDFSMPGLVWLLPTKVSAGNKIL